MEAIIVRISKKYWKKYHNTEEEITELWDKRESGYTHFKLNKHPKKSFYYVVVNIGGKLYG